MAHQYYSLPSLPLLCLLFLASILNANAGNITTYWGQNGYEGSLAVACSTGYYGIINIAFLYGFGNYQTPKMDLAGHCSPSTQDCSWLSQEIKECQKRGVKIFLSLGGATTYAYTLVSTEDARSFINSIPTNMKYLFICTGWSWSFE